ncbi:MAG: hypothetical protein HYX47_14705 [Burkholderiales bacterium]|nr:hypothetical protein [Burkholderiales bacterium]
MKAYYLLVPLSAAVLSACTVYRPVEVMSPPVSYVAPTNAVVLGAGPAVVTTTDWALLDSDGDGYANNVDRYPYDSRWH